MSAVGQRRWMKGHLIVKPKREATGGYIGACTLSMISIIVPPHSFLEYDARMQVINSVCIFRHVCTCHYMCIRQMPGQARVQTHYGPCDMVDLAAACWSCDGACWSQANRVFSGELKPSKDKYRPQAGTLR